MPSTKTLETQRVFENPDFDVISKQSQIRFLKTRVAELSEYEGVLGVDNETLG